MRYPSFFDTVPSIELEDKLGGFLGAFEDSRVEISYLDCVKLSGHSCPTVASAYLMALLGLEALYEGAVPQRSQIKLSVSQSKDEGVTGVMANVIAYIIGANDEGGFKGIGGQMSRNNLISYNNTDIDGTFSLTRLDSGKTVSMSSTTAVVPGSPDMMPLMQKSMQGTATDAEQERFRELWQGRVESMLLDRELWQKIVTIKTEE